MYLMVNEVVSFFQKQFTQEEEPIDFILLQHVRKLVTDDNNAEVCAMPSMEEVQAVVYELSGDSACGCDGFSSTFYQVCWDTVNEDVNSAVKAFYRGNTLPNSSLILIQCYYLRSQSCILILILDQSV